MRMAYTTGFAKLPVHTSMLMLCGRRRWQARVVLVPMMPVWQDQWRASCSCSSSTPRPMLPGLLVLMLVLMMITPPHHYRRRVRERAEQIPLFDAFHEGNNMGRVGLLQSAFSPHQNKRTFRARKCHVQPPFVGQETTIPRTSDKR